MLDETPQPPETMAERHARLLSRLSELSLGAAEDLAARAATAQEPLVAAQLHAAFAKAGQCLRQTVMLEARLAEALTRGQVQAQRLKASMPDTPTPERRRKERLEARLEPLIWERLEREEDQWERISDLYERLGQEVAAPGFMTEPFPAQLARLMADLGLDDAPAPSADLPPRPVRTPFRDPIPDPAMDDPPPLARDAHWSSG